MGSRGEGRAGCVFWLLVVILGGLVAAKVIPVKIAQHQLKDHMEDIAITRPRANSKWIEQSILQRAKELSLPVRGQDVEVQKPRNRVIMHVEFVVPIELLVYTYRWEIEIHVDRDIFDF